jgi:Chitin binding Peritrophin-A domain
VTWYRAAAMAGGAVLALTMLPGTMPAAVAAPRHASASAFTCPRPNGLYTDPTSQIRFYHCRNSVPTRHDCPASTYWVQITKRCEWPGSLYAPAPLSDSFTDVVGAGPAGETPETRARAARAGRGLAAVSDTGGEITYTIALTAADPLTSASIQISYPDGLSWVGGQDCFDDGTGIVDCMVYPGQDAIASVFTLQASLLALGPQTVTAHLVSVDPPAATPVPDRSLTCTTLTGLVVIC